MKWPRSETSNPDDTFLCRSTSFKRLTAVAAVWLCACVISNFTSMLLNISGPKLYLQDISSIHDSVNFGKNCRSKEYLSGIRTCGFVRLFLCNVMLCNAIATICCFGMYVALIVNRWYACMFMGD